MGKIGQFFIGAAKNPSAGQTKRINTAHLYGFVAKLLGHCFDVMYGVIMALFAESVDY